MGTSNVFELVIIGNKIDLIREKKLPRAVQYINGEKLALVNNNHKL